jgi:arylsulfatase A-like enzyme
MPRSSWKALLVSLAVAGYCAGCGGAAKPATIDAVFLIVIDTMRPDRLSCYGSTVNRTSAMDRIAASGVRFENAHSPASWTVPSMGSMMTSRYPTQLGLVERPPDRDTLFHWRDRRPQINYSIPAGVATLASLLDDAGFHSVAFVNQPYINAGDGFEQGFAEWCFSTAQDSIAWHDTGKPIPTIRFPANTDLAEADPLLVAECKRWLQRNADRRPFVWVHLVRPHMPYTPLVEYLPKDLQKPGIRVAPVIKYTAEVREVDDLVGDLLAAIDSTVGLARSLVILASDHGEEFGEHGGFGHGHSLYGEVIRVPLLIAGPSVPPGATVSAYASTIDLAPTILDLVGAKARIPEGFQGTSLLPLIRGGQARAPIYSEGLMHGATKRSLIEDGFKLVFDAQAQPSYQLFDLVRDPLEQVDISASQRGRATRMERALAGHSSRMVHDLALAMSQTEIKESPETERVLQAMRTLGYIGK